MNLLTDIAVLRTQIAGYAIDVVWESQLQRDTMTRLAHASTSIEGNPLTLSQVSALARDEVVSAPLRARLEVQQYLAAIRWVWAESPGAEMTEAKLLYLHRLLTQDTLASPKCGVYKSIPNRVVDPAGYLVYMPPSPQRAQPLVLAFLDWLNSPETRVLDPIIVSAIAHHRLVSIHPFSDGNGRISRLLGLWVMHVREVDARHLCTLDDYFQKDRDLYYLKLQQARDLDDDLTYWLDYVALGMRDTLLSAKQRLALVRVGSHHVVLPARQEAIIRFLRDQGKVSSSQLEYEFQITRSRVNQLVKPLVDQGVIQREGQTRSTRYFLGGKAS